MKILATLLITLFLTSISTAQTGEVLPNDFNITTTGAANDAAFDANDAAIAYNSTADEYLLVYTADRIAGEDEIFGQRIDAATGTNLGAAFRISVSGPDGVTTIIARKPDVAYSAVNDAYLVVWESEHIMDREYEIFGQLINNVGGLTGSNFRISTMGVDFDRNTAGKDAKVVANAFTGDYAVVWSGDEIDGEDDIYFQLVDAAGTLSGSRQRVSNTAGTGTGVSPSIAHNSTADGYIVVFRADPIAGKDDIYVQLLDKSGVVVGSVAAPIQVTNLPAANDANSPDVVYNATEDKYLIVWDSDKMGDDEIFMQYMSPAGVLQGGIGSDIQVSQTGTANDGKDAASPKVVWNNTVNQYLITYRAEENVGAFEIYIEALDASLNTLENDVRATDVGVATTGTTFNPIAPIAVTYSTGSQKYFIAYEADDDSAPVPTVNSEFEIFGQQWEVPTPTVLPTIAITEWICNPTATQSTDEWVEIYNYGTDPVDLQDWRLKDEDADNSLISGTSYLVGAGQYVILARDKANFEALWLDGCPSHKVLEVGMALANKTDEIILEDASGNVVWSVAYQNDKTKGRATYYTESTYTNRVWGSKASPGVDRNGNDVTGTLGYEKNNATADPLAYTSTTADIGSPLNGQVFNPDLVRGDALDFDGIDDYIDLGNNPNLNFDYNEAYTISAWVKVPTGTTTSGHILSKFDGNTFAGWTFTYVGATGAIDFLMLDPVTFDFFEVRSAGGFDVRDGQWHHIAMSYNGSGDETGVTIYVDGIESTTVIQAGTISGSVQSNAPAFIGNFDAGTEYFEGQIDELMVWSTARTAIEIKADKHLTRSVCDGDLVAYYQMNDGTTATVLTDKTGNGNNGILTNMNASTDWVASAINTGNDGAGSSIAETIAGIATGASTQNFVAANLAIDFLNNSSIQDVTTTYQAFVPNSTSAVNGFAIINNPVWTINSSIATPNFVANYTFTYPSGALLTTDANKYNLYWRASNSTGDWAKIATASQVTTTTVTFNEISQMGQFLVAQRSSDLITDVRGKMYNFDGADDYIDMGNPAGFNSTDAITLEAWVKMESIGGNQKIITKFGDVAGDDSYSLQVLGGEPQFQLKFGAWEILGAGMTININEWNHIVGTYDGNNMIIYVNGIAQNSMARTGNFDLSTATFKIGGWQGGDYLNGSVEEVKVWNVARTQAEIRAQKHLTLLGNEAGLVAYYQFNTDAAVGSIGGVKDGLGLLDGTTQNMTAANRVASQVAVAGGTVDRMTIGAGGVYNFVNTDVAIEFGGTTPDGEIVVARLETEKPHGWESIGGDVDNEYLVVDNYGNNATFSPVQYLTINRMGYVAPADVASPCTNLTIHKRASNDFGATWGAALGCADAATAGNTGSISYGNGIGVTSFSQIVTVNNGNNTDLPVELLSFDAIRTNKTTVQLDWATATETNNKGFEIQRMFAGQTEFETVGWVNGNGTTPVTSYYQELDENGSESTTYYRLQQLDFDGTATYSPIRSVDGMVNVTGGLDVLPNPTTGQIAVRIKDKATAATFHIYNSQGILVETQEHSLSANNLTALNDLSHLATGVYVLQVLTNTGVVYTQKIIKQ